ITSMHADYTVQVFDQLMDVIDKIKNNPDDKRIILSSWNPLDLKKMTIPPCHICLHNFMSSVGSYHARCINSLLIWDLVFHSTLHHILFRRTEYMIVHVCGMLPCTLLCDSV
ncbi:Os11g0615250, partial [Oryza sativa Japonica Group]